MSSASFNNLSVLCYINCFRKFVLQFILGSTPCYSSWFCDLQPTVCSHTGCLSKFHLFRDWHPNGHTHIPYCVSFLKVVLIYSNKYNLIIYPYGDSVCNISKHVTDKIMLYVKWAEKIHFEFELSFEFV